MNSSISDTFNVFLKEADALLIVPPFASINWPSLGVHLLQSYAKKYGYRVRILYVNLLFSSMIGNNEYIKICNAPRDSKLGDRIFCSSAFSLPLLGERAKDMLQELCPSPWGDIDSTFTSLKVFASKAEVLSEELGFAIAKSKCSVVGCTTTFDQTLPALAILKAVKKYNPNTITLLGGANCDGEMAKELSKISCMIDYIFSGESEKSFCNFLSDIRQGQLPDKQIIYGERCDNLSALPRPEYDEYFQQLNTLNFPVTKTWIPYESSRGCWWGEKRHCTFCGLNGTQMKFRKKDPNIVFKDIIELTTLYPSNKICMTDNIMPVDYHKTLVQKLADIDPPLFIFYEQKANLSLQKVYRLSCAGIKVIQPGIESLSTRLLSKIRKGVSVKQNIALLRYARICEVDLNWNILFGIPGDHASDYYSMLKLFPAIVHLCPPLSVSKLSIDRFSPYFDNPHQFGISNINALSGYHDVYPPEVNIEKIAYHFTAAYESGSNANPILFKTLLRAVTQWKDMWDTKDSNIPSLNIMQLDSNNFMLIDTRPEYGAKVRFIDREKALAALVGGRPEKCNKGKWAVIHKYALYIDEYYVPLATTDYKTLKKLERI